MASAVKIPVVPPPGGDKSCASRYWLGASSARTARALPCAVAEAREGGPRAGPTLAVEGLFEQQAVSTEIVSALTVLCCAAGRGAAGPAGHVCVCVRVSQMMRRPGSAAAALCVPTIPLFLPQQSRAVPATCSVDDQGKWRQARHGSRTTRPSVIQNGDTGMRWRTRNLVQNGLARAWAIPRFPSETAFWGPQAIF
jgi:hypothetical protein